MAKEGMSYLGVVVDGDFDKLLGYWVRRTGKIKTPNEIHAIELL